MGRALPNPLLLSVAAGAVFRLAQYFWRPSYWRDEIALLANITGKSFGQLLTGSLDFGQTAPPLFAASLKCLAILFGPHEYIQRLLPTLVGIVLLYLFARIATRCLTTPAAILAIGLLAFSNELIWRGAEAKQYSMDVFSTVVILGAAGRAMTLGTRRSFVSLCLLGALGVWFSYTAILLFPAIGLIFLLRSARRGGRSMLVFALGILPFALSFAALYLLAIRPQIGNEYLHNFWLAGFVPWARPAEIPLWLLRSMWGLLVAVLQPHDWLGFILVPLVIAGIVHWHRTGQREKLALCLLPIAVSLLAAGMHCYPFGGERVSLFLLPLIALLAGAGMEGFGELLARRTSAPAQPSYLLIALILTPLLATDCYHLVRPRLRSNLRPIIAQLRQFRQPGEPIYVGKHLGELLWYWPDAPGPLWTAVPDSEAANWHRLDVPGAISMAMPPAQGGHQAFWYILSDKPARLPRELRDLDRVRAVATESHRIAAPGVLAVRFQMKSTPVK